MPSPGPPIGAWWYPLAPIVFIVGSGVLALMLLVHNPGAALLGAAIVLCGLAARWLLTRRSRVVAVVSANEERELMSERQC